MRRIGVAALLGALLVFGLLQLHQPDVPNPPADASTSFEAVVKPAHALAAPLKRACYDCHSNQTQWPWYSKVAPLSWMIAEDVVKGRARLNFSEWGRYGPEMARIRMTEICSEVQAGKMPLKPYLLLHPGAKLTGDEVNALCAEPVGMSR